MDLLPALPDQWAAGFVRGIGVKGNLELDLEWQGRKPLSLRIRNRGGQVIILIRWKDMRQELILQAKAVWQTGF